MFINMQITSLDLSPTSERTRVATKKTKKKSECEAISIVLYKRQSVALLRVFVAEEENQEEDRGGDFFFKLFFIPPLWNITMKYLITSIFHTETP